MRKYYYSFFILLCVVHSHAQDANFSQFFSSPLTLNAANTGNFNGDLRLAGNFRNQWQAFNNAFSTFTFSADAPIMKNKIAQNDRLSIGLLALSDQSGNGLLKQNYLSASLAFKKGFDEFADYSLSVGFQATYGSANFNTSLARFEDQLTPGGFLLTTTENLAYPNTAKSFADINMGAIYAAAVADDKYFYVGASVNHLLEPITSILSNESALKRRYNLHGGGYLPMGDHATLHASFQYQYQAGYQEFILGSAYSYFIGLNANKYYELYAGAWLRFNDAVIPYIGMEWNQLRFGFSYDINYSGNRTAPSYYRTGEFSILQILNRDNSLRGTKCPKF